MKQQDVKKEEQRTKKGKHNSYAGKTRWWEVPEGRIPAKLHPTAEGGAKRELSQKAELALILFLGLQHHSQRLVVIETSIKATIRATAAMQSRFIKSISLK